MNEIIPLIVEQIHEIANHKSLIGLIFVVVTILSFILFLAMKDNKKSKLLLNDIKEKDLILDNILHSIPGGIAIYKISETIETLFSSAGVPALSGRTMEEYEEWIKGDLLDNTVYQEDVPRFVDAIKNQVPQGKPIDLMFRLKHKSGEVVWVQLSAVKIREEDGLPIYYAVFTKVPDAARMYKNMLDESLSAIYVCDAKSYELLYINDRIRKMGFPIQENFTGRKCYEFLLQRNTPCPFCKMENLPKDDFLIREFTPPNSEKHLLMKGKLIDWNGIEAHIEYISDETERIDTRTKLQRLNERLALSENRLKAAIHHSGLHFWEYDVQNDRAIYWERVRRELNLTEIIEDYPEGWIKMGQLLPEFIDQYRQMHRDLKNGVKEVEQMIQILPPRATTPIWIKAKYTNIFDENGMPIKAIGAGIDVTEQVLAEIRYNEQVTAISTIDANAIGTFRFNLTKNWCGDGHSIYPSVLKLQEAGTVDGFFSYGYSQNANAKDLENFSKVFNRESLIEQFNQGKDTISFEHRYHLEDSSIAWIRTYINMTKNPSTGDVEAVIYAVNIHDQKVAEALIHTVINIDYDFVMVIDVNKGTSQIYGVGETMENPFSLQSDDFDRHSEQCVRNTYVGDDMEGFIQKTRIREMVKVLERKDSESLFYSLKDFDDTIHRKQLTYTYLDKESQLICCIRHDITKLYEAEQNKNLQLQKALTEAKNASKAKSDFLSRMSHEIRTPMNAIIGLSELAIDEIEDLRARDYFKKINASSEYLLGLINDILDMSRIEQDKIEFHPEIVKVDDFLANIVEITRPLVEEKEISLTIHREKAKLEYAKFDKMRAQQVLLNLLSNAIKFTGRGGEVQVHLKILQRNGNDVSVKISIEDNGIGMRSEFLEKVFLPFEQEKNALTSMYAGTGLGLAIVKNLVELSGGHIWVESNFGIGTKFTIHTHVEVVEQAIGEQEINIVEEAVYFDRKKVLLVEDNEINMEIAQALLEKRGMQVQWAANGREAIDIFMASEEHEFDLILMDIQMPILDGLIATQQIRLLVREDAKTVPIIAMTANAFDEDVEKSKAAGMNNHLSKPINPKQLYKTLQVYLNMA